MSTVEQILDTAAQILSDPAAWHQGFYTDDHKEIETAKSLCVLGACAKAAGLTLDEIGAARVRGALTPVENALQVVGESLYPEYAGALDESGFILTEWNDDAGRLHSEVLELVEKGRAYAAEKGL